MTVAAANVPARSALARLATERTLALASLGLVGLHVVDDNFLQPEPGMSPVDHLPGGLTQLALVVAAAWAYPRVRAGGTCGAGAPLRLLRRPRGHRVRLLLVRGQTLRRRLHRLSLPGRRFRPARDRDPDALAEPAVGRQPPPPLPAARTDLRGCGRADRDRPVPGLDRLRRHPHRAGGRPDPESRRGARGRLASRRATGSGSRAGSSPRATARP